jgi:hypothetical protein
VHIPKCRPVPVLGPVTEYLDPVFYLALFVYGPKGYSITNIQRVLNRLVCR